MAGMLPGVETARRRRVHKSVVDGGTSSRYFGSSSSSFADFSHGSIRRSSIPLFSTSTNHQSPHLPSMQRSSIRPAYVDENDKLDRAAKEAKDRLDERLKALRISNIKRAPARPPQTTNSERQMVRGNVETQMVGLKKSGSKRFDWAKLSWKSLEQEECAVCLEQFKGGERLMHLPCAHRFHSRCLTPWLDTNAQCPCCRMVISIE